MPTAPILALRPNVTQADAVRAFSRPGLSSLVWRVKAGSLERVAAVYVPYQFYEVAYTMARAPHQRLFAIDAVEGALDLFEFPQIPDRRNLLELTTRNALEPALTPAVSEELLREKVLRLIFQQGFFKMRATSLQFRRLPDLLHLPYWLGFYSSGEVVRCRVMDAVRRRIEGPKASAFFEQWLAA